MSERVEYRVRPVTRYVVTRYQETNEGPCGSECKGEFGNYESAYSVGYALARQDHDHFGYPVGDERIRYPQGGEQEKTLSDATDEDLLRELVSRKGTQPAPQNARFIGEFHASCIGIGKDHTADIYLSGDDLKALTR